MEAYRVANREPNLRWASTLYVNPKTSDVNFPNQVILGRNASYLKHAGAFNDLSMLIAALIGMVPASLRGSVNHIS